MANTSSHPLTVNGTRLDTWAYNIKVKNGMVQLPDFRGENLAVPGMHGEAWTPNKRNGPGSLTLSMWITDKDVDGNIVGSDPYANWRTNLDTVLRLFNSRYTLLDVRHQVGANPEQINQTRNPEFAASASYWGSGVGAVVRATGVDANYPTGTWGVFTATGAGPYLYPISDPLYAGNANNFNKCTFGDYVSAGFRVGSPNVALRFTVGLYGYDAAGSNVATFSTSAPVDVAPGGSAWIQHGAYVPNVAGVVAWVPLVGMARTTGPAQNGDNFRVGNAVTLTNQGNANVPISGTRTGMTWLGTAGDSASISPGDVRQAYCEVKGLSDPEMRGDRYGELKVSLDIPSAFWQDVVTSEFNAGPSAGIVGATQSLATFQTATAPMEDLQFVVDGQITNPRLTDLNTGHYVQLNASVATGSQWMVDTSTWSSKTGIGIEWTTSGTNQTANTVAVGAMLPRLFGLAPGSPPRVQLTGSSPTSGTRLRIRTRRKYL